MIGFHDGTLAGRAVARVSFGTVPTLESEGTV